MIYFVIPTSRLTQEMIDSSEAAHVSDLQFSSMDGFGNQFVVLSYAGGVYPLEHIVLGDTQHDQASIDQVLTGAIWQGQPQGNPNDNTKSLDFNGIDERVDFGDSFNYDYNDQFSISLWVKPQNIASRRAVFAKTTNDSNVYGYVAYIEPDGNIFTQIRPPSGGPNNVFYTGGNIQAQQWNHIVFTNEGIGQTSGMRFYINGALSTNPATRAINGSLLNGQNFSVGSRQSAFYFNGMIDELTFWNKQLDQTEVDELHNSGVSTNPLDHSAQANISNYYKMGDTDTIPNIIDLRGAVTGQTVNMLAENIVEDAP